MRILIDECLHTSLVEVAQARNHEAWHVNWLGLSGTTDWDLMPRIIADDWAFVTNNAADFRRIYVREEVYPGLIIVVPQVPPAEQRALFEALLSEFEADEELLNEVIEIAIDGEDVLFTRYDLPQP
jgi:predicted nuclease of predicted toxin-antitoxin system